MIEPEPQVQPMGYGGHNTQDERDKKVDRGKDKKDDKHDHRIVADSLAAMRRAAHCGHPS